MKIAIPVSSKDENAPMYDRFGRSIFYAVFDSDTEAFEYFLNPASDARGGAGPQAVQFLVSKGVNTVIAPSLGPNASTALKNSNVTVYVGASIPIKELITKCLNNELEKLW